MESIDDIIGRLRASLGGRLRFGDEEQLRLLKLLEKNEGTEPGDRIGAWIDHSLLCLGGCPPEAMASWASRLEGSDRSGARRKVAAIKETVLALELFLEREANDHGEAPPDRLS